MNNINRKGIEQGRAEAAYNFVSLVLNEKKEFKKKYKSGVKKLPVLIKTNGLGQSLAFIKKRDDGWDKIYKQLSQWLEEKQYLNKEEELVGKVIKMPSDNYRQLTLECIALLNWMRRFADGLIKEE